MKVLVYGHAGWIGSQFLEILKKNNINYVLGTVRVDDTSSLFRELDAVLPSHVVSFIGRTHGIIDNKAYPTIDYLENPGKLVENVRDNLFSPISLALACKERGIHYTYLGTGCIFNYSNTSHVVEGGGTDEHKFNEDDIPNFFGSSYSIMKGITDRLMHQLCALNLRIRMPIIAEENSRNFITKIVSYSKICSVPNSMSVLDELLPIVLKMMESGLTGTINLTNPGVISHNEILEMYKKHVDPEFTWTNFSIEEQRKTIMCDRSNNWLDTSVLEKFAPEVRHIRAAVEDTIKKYKNTNAAVAVTASKSKIKECSGCNNNNNNTFADDAVLFVTGGAGFIGSHFINNIYFKYRNIKIINFDALYYCANEKENIKYEIRQDANRYTFIHGNLQSLDLLTYIF